MVESLSSDGVGRVLFLSLLAAEFLKLCNLNGSGVGGFL